MSFSLNFHYGLDVLGTVYSITKGDVSMQEMTLILISGAYMKLLVYWKRLVILIIQNIGYGDIKMTGKMQENGQ